MGFLYKRIRKSHPSGHKTSDKIIINIIESSGKYIACNVHVVAHL